LLDLPWNILAQRRCDHDPWRSEKNGAFAAAGFPFPSPLFIRLPITAAWTLTPRPIKISHPERWTGFCNVAHPRAARWTPRSAEPGIVVDGSPGGGLREANPRPAGGRVLGLHLRNPTQSLIPGRPPPE